MTKLRKRPVTIEGVHWTGTNLDEVLEFVREPLEHPEDVDEFVQMLDVGQQTIEVFDYLHDTWVKCLKGQWVLRGVEGELYPCDHSVIEQTYDILDDG